MNRPHQNPGWLLDGPTPAEVYRDHIKPHEDELRHAAHAPDDAGRVWYPVSFLGVDSTAVTAEEADAAKARFLAMTPGLPTVLNSPQPQRKLKFRNRFRLVNFVAGTLFGAGMLLLALWKLGVIWL